jgi:hypothetical protein
LVDYFVRWHSFFDMVAFAVFEMDTKELNNKTFIRKAGSKLKT